MSFTDFVGTKRGLAAALHSGDPAYDGLPQRLLGRLEPALQSLLARAADGGSARDDVTAREVLLTVALICQPVRGEPPSFNQRMTQVFMAGLRRWPARLGPVLSILRGAWSGQRCDAPGNFMIPQAHGCASDRNPARS